MKRIALFFIVMLLLPTAMAMEDVSIPLGDYPFLNANFENCTITDQVRIKDFNLTTESNYTFPVQNAKKITYQINDSVEDFLIIWQCSDEEYFETLSSLHDLSYFYSDYTTKPVNGVCFMEIPSRSDDVYGIILDCENITYTEEDLVHHILGLYSYGLTSDQYPDITFNGLGGYYQSSSHYNGPVTDPYDIARNDPYAYYDYFDYEDNIDIDEYLYDYGYDE